jgi:hypothetical protein
MFLQHAQIQTWDTDKSVITQQMPKNCLKEYSEMELKKLLI